MDNIEKDVAAALRLGYGCRYGRYKVDYPCTADHSADIAPALPDDEPPRYCRNCGKAFVPKHGSLRYCSEDCRVELERLRKRLYARHAEKPNFGEGICIVCQKTFQKTKKTQACCNKSCAAVARNRARTKG